MEATDEWSTEDGMTDNTIWRWYGLDVSKDSFTAALYNGLTKKPVRPAEKSFPLDRKGVALFLRWRNSLKSDLFADAVAMEATGGYSAKLCRLLLKAEPGLRVSVCNPLPVSRYIQSFGPDKDDVSDALCIAMYGCDRQPRQWRAPDPDQARLRALQEERQKLVDMHTALSNRGETIEVREVAGINSSILKVLEKKIAELDTLMREAVKSRKDIADEIALLDSVPGVGFTSAVVIYALLGSLRQYTRKELSALSGVCPANMQSGKSLRKSRISKRGPSLLRRILYCDTTSAIGNIPSVKALKDRLDARENSSRMRSRCACMRKLLLICRGVVVSGKPFEKGHEPEKRQQKSNEKSENKSEKVVQTA